VWGKYRVYGCASPPPPLEFLEIFWNWDGVVDIVTRLSLTTANWKLVSRHGQGIFFFASRRAVRSYSLLCSWYGSLPCWSSGWGVKVIIHLHVVSRLRMRGIYPYTPSNSFMVWCFITQVANLRKPLGILSCYLIFFLKIVFIRMWNCYLCYGIDSKFPNL
jgi:hypothetical protein